MLPQSKNTHDFLVSLKDIDDPDFPMEAVNELLESIIPNEH